MAMGCSGSIVVVIISNYSSGGTEDTGHAYTHPSIIIVIFVVHAASSSVIVNIDRVASPFTLPLCVVVVDGRNVVVVVVT